MTKKKLCVYFYECVIKKGKEMIDKILSGLKSVKEIDDMPFEGQKSTVKVKEFLPLGKYNRDVFQMHHKVKFYFLTGGGELNAWYQDKVKELFTNNEFVGGVLQAFDQYMNANEWCGSELWDFLKEYEEDAYKILKEEGFAPFIDLCEVYFDHDKDLVLFNIACYIDGNLDEHGVSILYKDNEWKFGYACDFDDELSHLDEEYDEEDDEWNPAVQEMLEDSKTYKLKFTASGHELLSMFPDKVLKIKMMDWDKMLNGTVNMLASGMQTLNKTDKAVQDFEAGKITEEELDKILDEALEEDPFDEIISNGDGTITIKRTAQDFFKDRLENGNELSLCSLECVLLTEWLTKLNIDYSIDYLPKISFNEVLENNSGINKTFNKYMKGYWTQKDFVAKHPKADPKDPAFQVNNGTVMGWFYQ